MAIRYDRDGKIATIRVARQKFVRFDAVAKAVAADPEAVLDCVMHEAMHASYSSS